MSDHPYKKTGEHPESAEDLAKPTIVQVAMCGCSEVRRLTSPSKLNDATWACTKCGTPFRRDLKPDVEEMDRRLTDLERRIVNIEGKHREILTIKDGALNQEAVETLKTAHAEAVQSGRPEVLLVQDTPKPQRVVVAIPKNWGCAGLVHADMDAAVVFWNDEPDHSYRLVTVPINGTPELSSETSICYACAGVGAWPTGRVCSVCNGAKTLPERSHRTHDGLPCPGTCVELANDLEDARTELKAIHTKSSPGADRALRKRRALNATVAGLAVEMAHTKDGFRRAGVYDRFQEAVRDLIEFQESRKTTHGT